MFSLRCEIFKRVAFQFYVFDACFHLCGGFAVTLAAVWFQVQLQKHTRQRLERAGM
jgi:hypothetical protein